MISAELSSHLATKDEDRNQNWDERFFKLFCEENLKLLTAEPQQGPDGWPYLMSEISIDSTAGDLESAQKILFWLATRGIGLVVNPQRTPYPDFVFSYGMIWSFRETGLFIKSEKRDENKSLEIADFAQAKFGVPTLEYFPEYARKIVRQFFQDQNVLSPKILMASPDGGSEYDLCFSLESLGNPPPTEHNGILEALSWFFPPHYSLALISEKGLPAFTAL